MRRVYFVPGIAGSELFAPPPLRQQFWIGYTELALGGLIAMGLGPDGLTPEGPCQVQMSVGRPLPSYYDATIQLLQNDLGPQWDVVPWAYDWRIDLIRSGLALASAIMSSVPPDEPCVIAAHSAGGLVARAAWAALGDAGMTGLVSRIITMGTPHQGSYSAVQLFSGGSSQFLSLLALTSIASVGLAFVPGPPSPCSASTFGELLAVVYTWPSMYELFPLLGSPDQGADPLRPLLFSLENWHGKQLSQPWLTLAATTWATLMLSPISMPPKESLTTVAGNGLSTPDILTYPQYLGGVAAYSSTEAGDGAVTVQDALLSASWQYTIAASHQDVAAQFCASGQLAAEVRADRTATTPVPPVDTTGGSLVTSLGVPPYPNPRAVQIGQSGMGGGDC